MSSTHASLDAAATERKARLAKLASLKRKQPEPEEPPNQIEGREISSPPVEAVHKKTDAFLSGRNYDAETKGPKLGFSNDPSAGQSTLEERATSIALSTADQARKDEEVADKGIDLFKLQPKKPNWDLKRDLDEKMRILNVRTQNAIAHLVRERIESAKKTAQSTSQNAIAGGDEQEEEVGIEGNTLVEGVHLREREEEQDALRERENEEDGPE